MNTNIVNPKKARRIDSDQFDVGSVTSRMLMGERTLSILCPFIYLPFLYAYAFFGAWMFTRIESKHTALQSPYTPNNKTGCGSSYEPFADVVRDGIPYSISVFTTVGYGVQAPETSAGRIATIFYAMLGIPLYFAFTADIQDRIDQLIFVWLYGLIFNKKRHQIKIARWKKFLVTIFIAVSYLFVQGAITMYLESKEECGGRWTYMVAIYFVFQSAALIGFGDLTASRSLYLTVHLPMLIIGQVLLQSLFVEAI
uniref:Potassium channel domain-containing protein n=1 Tax=Meloidogyne incognita TaxID=6306 RepID=A0A914NI74_MELIC